MATERFQVLVGKHVVLEFCGDFSQASSQLMIKNGLGGWSSTPFQVASFRHRPIEAAIGLNGWCESEGGGGWIPGRTRGLKLKHCGK